MQGMRTDEARRYSDGYFDMKDDDRKDYDSVRDKFMDFFGSDDFTKQGWTPRGRGGDDSDSSDSDSDDDMNRVVEKLKDFLGGKSSGALGDLIKGGNGKDLLERFMGGRGRGDSSDSDSDRRGRGSGSDSDGDRRGGRGGRGDSSDDDDWMRNERNWEGNNGGEWSQCSPQRGGGGRGGQDQCDRGMCCAIVPSKQGTYCVSRYSNQMNFRCLEEAKKLASTAIAMAATLYILS